MTELKSIPGLGKSSLELLEVAGFPHVDSLARCTVDHVFRELTRANEVLSICSQNPDWDDVSSWVTAAREIAGITDVKQDTEENPVNYEQNQRVASMLSSAPFAIPLPARVLMDHQLGVAEIPPGILLTSYSGDLDVRVEKRIPGGTYTKPVPAPNSYVRIAEASSSRLEINTSKIRSIDNMEIPSVKIPAAKSSQGSDRVALLRAPRDTTNKGRSPKSRWYIRGVLHSHPVSIYVGALVTLLLMVIVPLAITSGFLLLASEEMPKHFGWVPSWLLVFPAVLPVFGIMYLIWGLGGSCRICGQKLFRHRAHRKNSKAHHVRGLGYVIPLCCQILIFRWFRCTHCGTPVRLKE